MNYGIGSLASFLNYRPPSVTYGGQATGCVLWSPFSCRYGHLYDCQKIIPELALIVGMHGFDFNYTGAVCLLKRIVVGIAGKVVVL